MDFDASRPVWGRSRGTPARKIRLGEAVKAIGGGVGALEGLERLSKHDASAGSLGPQERKTGSFRVGEQSPSGRPGHHRGANDTDVTRSPSGITSAPRACSKASTVE